LVPCDFNIITLCDLTTWDSTILQLVIGAIVAAIFFIIQNKNTKMLNRISKERLEHLQENSINHLLWMKNGCINLQYESKKVFGKSNPIQGLIEKLPSKSLKQLTSELKDANERTITRVKNYIIKYHDMVSPQLENTLNSITKSNEKIQINDEGLHNNVKELSEIINQIDLLNETYNVKRSGKSPEPIYVNTLIETLRSNKRKASFVFTIPGMIILLVSIFSHGLFFRDMLNDWITYLGLYLVVLGLTVKAEKDYWFGLWFVFGSIIMLAFGISVGLNLFHF
jgi:gas vesicle protein